MSGLTFPSLLLSAGRHQFSLLDIALILLGILLAYWIMPGLIEGSNL